MAETNYNIFNNEGFAKMLESQINHELDLFVEKKLEEYQEQLKEEMKKIKPRLALFMAKQYEFEFMRDQVIIHLKEIK